MLKDVAAFLRHVLRSGKPLLSPVLDEANLLPVARQRKEFALELLRQRPFQDAIQFMNEQILRELAQTDPLDTDKLTLLRLKLGVVSDFPQVLEQFVNEYETIVLIQSQQEEGDAYRT